LEHISSRTFESGLKFSLVTYEATTEYSDVGMCAISIGAGSANDPEDKRGLAHLVEHLVRPDGDIARKIFKKGQASIGPASTEFDCTQYRFLFSLGYYENFLRGIRTMIEGITLDQQALVKSKNELIDELEVKLKFKTFAESYFELYKLSYKRHPYRWYTLGQREHIPNIALNDCEAFLKQFYRPDNIVIRCVIPNIMPDQIEGFTQRGAEILEGISWPGKCHIGKETENKTWEENAQNEFQNTIIMKTDEGIRTHPLPPWTPSVLVGIKFFFPELRFNQLPILDRLLFGKNSVLVPNLRAKNCFPPKTYLPTTKWPGLYEILAVASYENRNQCNPEWATGIIEELAAEFDRIRNGRFSNDELNHAKAGALKRIGKISQGDILPGKFNYLFICNALELMGRPLWDLKKSRSEIESMTREELHSFANEFLKPENMNAVRCSM
jgi:hypothetical protein